MARRCSIWSSRRTRTRSWARSRDISKTDKGLVLKFSFDYQGNQVAAVVTMTPAPDGKIGAQIDFADGAYVVTGAAVKKEKEKAD